MKSHKRSKVTAVVLLAFLALIACRLTPTPTAMPAVGMPNPASVYCEQHGGTLEIRDSAAGQYGICHFPDGSQCDEWAYFRGECQPGAGQPTAEQPIAPVATEEPQPLPTATAEPDAQTDTHDWVPYHQSVYGFELRFPPDWSIDDSSPNFIILRYQDVWMSIGYRHPGEPIPIMGTGAPAGDMVDRPTIPVLGQPRTSQALVFEGHTWALFYEIISLPQADLGFRLNLGNSGPEASISQEIQDISDQIVETLQPLTP
jgi:putative hemolysin